MRESEDRFPLLKVYLEDGEERWGARARTVSRGAANIVMKWPRHLTFASYMSMIGLLSLIMCFIFSMLVLSFTPSEGHGSGLFCLKNCNKEHFRINILDDLTDSENATFIVDVPNEGQSNRKVACAVESYLKWTSLPVYHVLVSLPGSSERTESFRELSTKFKNYKTISVRADTFLNGTSFSSWGDRVPLSLQYLIKVLISWNFGGTVFDTRVMTLANFSDLLKRSGESLVIGLTGDENVLISSGKVCHSFIFELIKHLANSLEPSQEKAVEIVHREFCQNERNCDFIKIITAPFFCNSTSLNSDCIFMVQDSNNESQHLMNRLCPFTAFLPV